MTQSKPIHPNSNLSQNPATNHNVRTPTIAIFKTQVANCRSGISPVWAISRPLFWMVGFRKSFCSFVRLWLADLAFVRPARRRKDIPGRYTLLSILCGRAAGLPTNQASPGGPPAYCGPRVVSARTSIIFLEQALARRCAGVSVRRRARDPAATFKVQERAS